MHTFYYEARHPDGALKKGKIQAKDSNHVADQLIRDHLIPIKIQMTSPAITWNFPDISIPFFGKKITSDVLTIFCRQMHSLLKAGIPIISAIQRLADITTHAALADALKAVSKEIALGTALSKAMKHHPKVFSFLLTALVTSGEANGRLDEAFLQASQHFELESISKKRVKAALRYPILVVIFAFSAIMLINVFVIPKFAHFYASFHATLPLPTRMLIAFSLFVHRYWWMIIAFIFILMILTYYFLHHPAFRVLIDRAKIKLPIFGSIIERIIMANFSRNLAMLLKTGVTLLESLSLVADVVNNAYAKEKILEMLELIERGNNLAQAASSTHFFSPLVLQMLAVGEETGNIDTMLLEAGEFYEREVDYDIKQLTDKIEPILLVVVGVLVLLLALGVFLPMWNLVYVVR